MLTYYKVDNRKITLREYWNIYPSPKILIPWLLARFGIPMRMTSGMGIPDSVREMAVPEEALSPQAREKFQPLVAQCLQLGFHSPRYYAHTNLRQDTRTSFVSLLHQSGEFSIRLMHSLALQVNPPKETLLKVLMSGLVDGRYFYTSDQNEKFRSAPGIIGKRLLGAPLAQLVESHQQSLESLRLTTAPLLTPSLAAMDDLWDRYEKLSTDFGVQRGLYVPMTPEELAREQHIMTEASAMTPNGGEHAEVLVEISAQQNKKSGWSGVLTILAVSLILFVAAGAQQWSWELLLILLPIVFIHELGHYLAMRAFNYRNLKMFFIPFFGAAVAGQHFNVPGWKKVIVSLMGPVPGIFLGLIVGGAGMLLHQVILTKVALMLLVLNGFNLLPLLPFDGGQVFHALLFSRHRILDATFRVLAAIGLIVIGAYTDSKVLMYVSIPMFIGIPLAYRLARIASELRLRGVPAASEDNQTIPPETAQAIVGELKKSAPKATPTKILAQQALQIFETMNARPPSWPVTIGLLFAHFASFGIAVVFAVIFIVAQRSGFQGRLADRLAKHALVCGQSQVWSGAQATNLMALAPNTIVATLPKGADVAKTFQGLTNRLPAQARFQTFGDTLLLSLPADLDEARKTWRGELQRLTKEVFVTGTNFGTSMSLSCSAPSTEAAEKIAAELSEYFDTFPTTHLIPPWSPEDGRSAEEVARHQLARQTYLTLVNKQSSGTSSDPEVKEIRRSLTAASRQGDNVEADALQKKLSQAYEKVRRENLQAIRRGDYGPVDLRVVDLYIAMATNQTEEAEAPDWFTRELGERMGQLPVVAGSVSIAADRFSAQTGMVSHQQARLQLSFITFRQIGAGPPALVDWLCQKGCTDFKYSFMGGGGGAIDFIDD